MYVTYKLVHMYSLRKKMGPNNPVMNTEQHTPPTLALIALSRLTYNILQTNVSYSKSSCVH
jgi:hypothetical protein